MQTVQLTSPDSVFTPNNAAAARSVLTTEGAAHSCVVYFTKRTDGSRRRMVCRYLPEQVDAARFRFNPAERDLLPVWDLERGAPRMIPLDAVDTIKVLGSRPEPAQAPQPAPDRSPEQKRQDFERLKAELADFC